MLKGVGNIQTTTTSGAFSGFTDGNGNRLPVPYTITNGGVPVGRVSSGTVGANGALTLTTALDRIYAEIYAYFDAGKVFSGSPAGLYYTRMSSTTVGVVYNNLYTTGTPLSISSPTAIVDAGPGAYVANTGQLTLRSVNVPGNSLGNNGYMESRPMFSYSNSAGTKTIRLIYAAQNLVSASRTTAAFDYWLHIFYSSGVTNRQYTSQIGIPSTNTATTGVAYLVDTSADQTHALAVTVASDLDFAIVQSLSVIIGPT